jgi:hypothetical protein
MAGKAKYDWTPIFNDYQSWRSNDLGPDADFLAQKHPLVSIAALRQNLTRWRGRASQGLHPLTAKPDIQAETIYATIGKTFSSLRVGEKPKLNLDGDMMQDGTGQKMALGYLLPRARKIYEQGLSSRGKVGVVQFNMASKILEAHGLLGKKEIKTSSSFTQWPTETLTQFVNELGAQVLADRKDVGTNLPFTQMAEPEQYDDPARIDLKPGENTPKGSADK